MGTGAGRWRAVALCGLALCGLAGCREGGGVRTVQAFAELDRTSLDFGDVPVGEWKALSVHIRNVGEVPFRATDVVQLDGNPSFQISLDPSERIQPGESREVAVRFHPLAEQELTDHFRVDVDAEHRPTGLLSVRGRGAPTPIPVSAATLDFQTLEKDSDRTLAVTVRNPVDLPLSVSLAGRSAGQFTTDAIDVPPHGERTVSTRYAPHDNGDSAAELQMRACGDCTPTVVGLTGRAVPSAFSFDPAPMPFDQIPVHQSTQSFTQATNITWRPVSISTLTTSDVSFVPLEGPQGQTVGPGESVAMKVQFNARTSGPWVGTLNVHYVSDRARQSDEVLDARGGRPQLALTPVSIDFGDLPVGGKVERTVRLTNAGSTGDLHFTGLRADGDVGQFGAQPPLRGKTAYAWSGSWPTLGADALPIAPGTDALDVKVAFQPVAEGTFQATLFFQSDDMFSPERQVVVTGHAHTSGPCSFRLLPQPRLDFGNVPQGSGAVLGFRFENAGTAECAVKDIHLSQDAGGAFFMPGGALAGGVLEKDDAFSAMIAFKAPADGIYQGELTLTVNDPDHPVVHLPLAAVAQQSCLYATPNFLDFGPIRADCEPGTRHVLIQNQCPFPISLTGEWIGAGTSDQFSLQSAPSLPQTLQPVQGLDSVVAYARDVWGQHYSPLFFQAAGEGAPFLVPLLAETNHDGLEVEHFIQGTDNQLDVLFVVANTTTMQAYQDRLAQAVPGWMADAAAKGVDLRVGVTTTGLVARSGLCPGGAQGGEAGRLFPVDASTPRVVTPTTANATHALATNLHVGICHNLVQGLETMRAALTPPLSDHADDPLTPAPNDGNLGFLRTTARLAVVALADEDDHSGFDPQGYVELLRGLKGAGMAHRVSFSALVPTDQRCTTAGPSAPRFTQVANATHGTVESVCGASADYERLLEGLTQRAAGLQQAFTLSQTPGDPATLQVTVDGAVPPDGSWHYDAASNAIVFAEAPTPGQDVAVRYRAVCAGAP